MLLQRGLPYRDERRRCCPHCYCARLASAKVIRDDGRREKRQRRRKESQQRRRARGYHGEQSQHDAPHLAAADAQRLSRSGGAASLLKRGYAQRRQQPCTTYPTVDTAHDTF